MLSANWKSSPLSSQITRVLATSLFVVSLGVAPHVLADTAKTGDHPEVTHRMQVEGKIYEIVYNPADHNVYAAVNGDKIVSVDGTITEQKPSITVIDGKTDKIVKKIDTNGITPFGLSLNVETQKLYTTDLRSGAVGVFDVKTGKRVALIKVPEGENNHLRQVLADPATNTIYVGIYGSPARPGKPAQESAVWVVDGKTDTIKHVIKNPVTSATGLALDSAKNRLYVADMADSKVVEIDTKTNKTLRTFSTLGKDDEKVGTVNLELDAKNDLLYAVNFAAGNISVIDLKEGKVTDTIATGRGALSAKIHPQSGDLFVSNRNDGTIAIVDGKTHNIEAYLRGGVYPQTVAIAPDTGLVYVSNKAKGRGRNASDSIPTPYEPDGNTVIVIKP